MTGQTHNPQPEPDPTPKPVGVYAINLDRRPDRLVELERHLGDRGVSFTRVVAVDSQTVPDEELARIFPRRGPLGQVGRGDQACSLSHLKAMQMFLASDQAAAIVLEDDVEIARDFSCLLGSTDWIPTDHDLVKLEAYQTRGLKVLIGRCSARIGARSLHPLLSRHAGGAGYLVTRAGAKMILAKAVPMRVPIDHFLFNANVSALAGRMKSLQLVPAMVRQRRAEFGSDIGIARQASVPRGLGYWRREIVRGFYEIRLLHKQIPQALFFGARLVSIDWADQPQIGQTGEDV